MFPIHILDLQPYFGVERSNHGSGFLVRFNCVSPGLSFLKFALLRKGSNETLLRLLVWLGLHTLMNLMLSV